MDILKMLADLRQESEQLEQVIMALERMALGQGKRRGRPPASMAAEYEMKRWGRPRSRNKPKVPEQQPDAATFLN